jgi:hypothetical protein
MAEYQRPSLAVRKVGKNRQQSRGDETHGDEAHGEPVGVARVMNLLGSSRDRR